jgi:hypothetical protein
MDDKESELGKKLVESNLIINRILKQLNDAYEVRNAIQAEKNQLKKQRDIEIEKHRRDFEQYCRMWNYEDYPIVWREKRLYHRIKNIYTNIREYVKLKYLLDGIKDVKYDFVKKYNPLENQNPVDILKYLLPDRIKFLVENRIPDWGQFWDYVARFTRKYIVKYIRIYTEYANFLKYNENIGPKSKEKVKYKGGFMQYKKVDRIYNQKIKRYTSDMLKHATFVILKGISEYSKMDDKGNILKCYFRWWTYSDYDRIYNNNGDYDC